MYCTARRITSAKLEANKQKIDRKLVGATTGNGEKGNPGGEKRGKHRWSFLFASKPSDSFNQKVSKSAAIHEGNLTILM